MNNELQVPKLEFHVLLNKEDVKYCAAGNHNRPPGEFIGRNGRRNRSCERCLNRKRMKRKRVEESNATVAPIQDLPSSSDGKPSIPYDDSAQINVENLESFLQRCSTQASENEEKIDQKGIVEVDPSLSGKECALQIREQMLKVLGYQFTLIDCRVRKADPDLSTHRFYCSQDQRRKRYPAKSTKDGVKHRNCYQMQRFNCSSRLKIRVNKALKEANIQLYHEGHLPYVEVCTRSLPFFSPTLLPNQNALVVSPYSKGGLFQDWADKNECVKVVFKSELDTLSKSADMVLFQSHLFKKTISRVLASSYSALVHGGKVVVFGQTTSEMSLKLVLAGFVDVISSSGKMEARKPTWELGTTSIINFKPANLPNEMCLLSPNFETLVSNGTSERSCKEKFLKTLDSKENKLQSDWAVELVDENANLVDFERNMELISEDLVHTDKSIENSS